MRSSSRHLLILPLLVLRIAATADAGEWSCNRARQFHLNCDGVASQQPSQRQRAWVDSLLERLRTAGGQISHVDFFVRSSARLTLNGDAIDCPVFQLAAEEVPHVFYVSCEDLVVDFSAREILSPGVSGQSRHVSPSRSVAALVHSTGTRITGVPVGPCFTPPWFLWNPWFRGAEVWWY